MSQIALDWNCIIELEEERQEAPFLHQIRDCYKQGKILLCISSPSRLENPQNRTVLTIDESEWSRKLHIVGLEGIELVSSKTQAFTDARGVYNFDHNLELLVMQKMHALLFPDIDFSYYDYCHRMNVEPIPSHAFPNMNDPYKTASPEQQRIDRKWNNAKCDSLSLYAFSTWAEADDIFVTTDKNFHRKKAQLLQPFQIQRPVLAPLPEYAGKPPSTEPIILTEQIQNLTIANVIRGHIMTLQEVVAHLEARFAESTQSN